MSRGYPVSLIVEGRPCLVVGGGRVAARRVAALLECGAVVRVVAERVGPEVRALAGRPRPGRGGLELEERPYRRGEADGYHMVLAATDSREANRQVAADAAAAGVLVNSADDPAVCTFVLPAVARQGPVSVAVSTDGHSPALARWLRDRLAAGDAGGLGPELAVLAELLAEKRDEIRASGRSTESVDWRPALDSDMLELIRTGRLDEARERLRECLS